MKNRNPLAVALDFDDTALAWQVFDLLHYSTYFLEDIIDSDVDFTYEDFRREIKREFHDVIMASKSAKPDILEFIWEHSLYNDDMFNRYFAKQLRNWFNKNRKKLSDATEWEFGIEEFINTEI